MPGCLVFVYLYAFPYWDRLRSANEVPRILLTQQIVDRHTFHIDERLDELGSRFDVAQTPDGHRYSNKAPGLSLLAVPVYLLLRPFHPSMKTVTWAFRVTVVTVPSLLFLIVFFRLARRLGPGGEGGALCAYGLGSMALPYAVQFLSHQVAAACAGTAFFLAVRLVHGEAGRPRLHAAGVGALCGLAVLCEYQAFLAAAAVVGYLLWHCPRRVPLGGLSIVAGLPFAALLLFYHRACYGSPWKTGYSFVTDKALKEGALGIVGPNLEALKSTLFTSDNGLVVLIPWVLLAAVGLVAQRRSVEARVCAAIGLGSVLFVGSLAPGFARAGWSVGPRYATVALPFLGWLAAAGLSALRARLPLRTGAHALILVGVTIYVAATVTYPHWPTVFQNPLYEVSFHFLRTGRVPPSLGTLLHLRGALSLLPVFAVAAGLALGLPGQGLSPRVRVPSALAAALLCAAIVRGYGYLPIDSRYTPEQQKNVEQFWRFLRTTF